MAMAKRSTTPSNQQNNRRRGRCGGGNGLLSRGKLFVSIEFISRATSRFISIKVDDHRGETLQTMRV